MKKRFKKIYFTKEAADQYKFSIIDKGGKCDMRKHYDYTNDTHYWELTCLL